MNTPPPSARAFGTPTSTRPRKYGGPNGYGHRPVAVPLNQRIPVAAFPRACQFGAKGSSKPPPPLSVSLKPYVFVQNGGPGILNQRDTSGCTGFATAGATCTDLAARHTPIPCPSPVASYLLSICLSRALALKPGAPLPPLKDEGADPNENMDALARYGCPPIDVWGNYPPSSKTITQEPTVLQLEAASAWKLLGAYAITSKGDTLAYELMSAIAGGCPVCFAVEVDGAFEENAGAVISAPNPSDILGGHYLYAVGYTWDGHNVASLVVEFANSWDVTWGAQGFGKGNILFVRGMTDLYVMNVRRAPAGASTYHGSSASKSARRALVGLAAAAMVVLSLFGCRAIAPSPVPPPVDAGCDDGAMAASVGVAPRCPPCPCMDAGPAPVPIPPPPPPPDAGDVADHACARLIALGCKEGCDGGACLASGDSCAATLRRASNDRVTTLNLPCVAAATSAASVRACKGPWATACAGR